jgi:phage shock protein PspC (stress-responsive transcriptional regulator)
MNTEVKLGNNGEVQLKVEDISDQVQPAIETPNAEYRAKFGVAPKRTMLYRHPTDKMAGGVCGGLAEFTGIDPILLRALWVVATLITGGGGFIAYLALWLLLPVGTVAGGQVRPAAIELNESNLSRAATLLIGFGALWLLANLGILPWVWSAAVQMLRLLFWPMLLISAGYLLLRSTGKEVKLNFSEFSNSFAGMSKRVRQEGGKVRQSMNLRQSWRQFRQGFPLKRSRRDRMAMGVCGGIGQRLGIDSNLVRLVWAAFSIGSIGTGVLFYVLAGLFLPEEQIVGKPAPANGMVEVKVIDGSATTMV